MKGLAVALLVLALGGSSLGGQIEYFVPDIPTDPDLDELLKPSGIISYDTGVYGGTPELSVAGEPELTAIQKLDRPGSWLFTVKYPSDLEGRLASPAERRDVVRYDDTDVYSVVFCGASLSEPIPPGVVIDAVLLDGGDGGDLIVSFDIPLTLGTLEIGRSDLARFTRTGGTDCSGWQLAGLEFDAELAGDGVPRTSNLIGVGRAGGSLQMVFDIPTVLSPSSGSTAYGRGEIASWDGSRFSHFDALQDWPASSRLEALSCQANPGSVARIILGKALSGSEESLVLSWEASCSGGAEDYGIFEGALGDFGSHRAIDCEDEGQDLTEGITPAEGSRYYLVVAHQSLDEGSYGTAWIDGVALERPRPATTADRCAEHQSVTPCPSQIGGGGDE